MFKFIILSILFIAQLQANTLCNTNLNGMIHTFNAADKLAYEKKYVRAIAELKNSNESSYKALEYCEAEEKFDFRMVYAYIVESENRIYKLQELLIVD
ncbi:hypothetical protein GJV85_00260 [Sulfurimonas aquatica]|uniref:DUF4398 domain-containing protein n=1 Tax=Sulfurimonas aquatica TaxID=2672570 RepID=A0A975GBV6_9BACT|nr:hypothetical protein [Sulfurimonas aquatica]QSZ40614.1 hypothetical protein GJV85_00260 [Sulfurimonas aquatica]